MCILSDLKFPPQQWRTNQKIAGKFNLLPSVTACAYNLSHATPHLQSHKYKKFQNCMLCGLAANGIQRFWLTEHYYMMMMSLSLSSVLLLLLACPLEGLRSSIIVRPHVQMKESKFSLVKVFFGFHFASIFKITRGSVDK